MNFDSLSLEEKVGQRFIVGINSNNIDTIVELIKKYYIGGVILYRKNYKDYNDMLSVVKKLKEANKDNKIPLFIAIDQEGGRVNRMPLEFKNIKNIYDMSKKDVNLVYKNGDITGKMLSQNGINVNFSPVLDMYGKETKAFYKRCFYGDVDMVSFAGINYVKGLSNNKVLSVVKHFPGHGSCMVDSHFWVPYVFNKKNVLDNHIKPFEILIKNNIDAIMVGHLVIRGMTGGLPASISEHFLSNFLREKYGYNGLIITDDITMLSRGIYRFGCLDRAFLSGGDIILVKLNKSSNLILSKYVDLVKKHNYFYKLDESVERILSIKKKYNITDDVSNLGCNISDINLEIEKLNSLCEE